MGEAFVQAVTKMLSGVTGWFTSVFSSIGNIFATTTTGDGGATTVELTAVGWILSIVVAISVVGFGIKFIMSLVKRIRA